MEGVWLTVLRFFSRTHEEGSNVYISNERFKARNQKGGKEKTSSSPCREEEKDHSQQTILLVRARQTQV